MNSKNIILVEDDPDVCFVLKEILSSRFKQVDVAHDGNEGYELIQQKSPHIVLSDVTMPNSSGVEMVRRLRANGNNVPVVFLTAHNEKDTLLSAIRLGAFDFINKPFKIEELMKTIERALYTEKKKEHIDELKKNHASEEEIQKEQKMIGLIQATSVKKST